MLLLNVGFRVPERLRFLFLGQRNAERIRFPQRDIVADQLVLDHRHTLRDRFLVNLSVVGKHADVFVEGAGDLFRLDLHVAELDGDRVAVERSVAVRRFRRCGFAGRVRIVAALRLAVRDKTAEERQRQDERRQNGYDTHAFFHCCDKRPFPVVCSIILRDPGLCNASTCKLIVEVF